MNGLKILNTKPCHRTLGLPAARCLSCCCVLILAAPSWLPAENPPLEKLRLFSSAAGLVRAHVSESEETQAEWITVFTIEHIFWGPQELMNQRFKLSTRKVDRGGTKNIEFVGPGAVGEQSIWAVNIAKGKVWPGTSLAYFTRLPVRDLEIDRFRSVQRFAAILEEIAVLPLDEQLARLKCHAVHNAPDVSFWAISVLSGYYSSRRSEAREWRTILSELQRHEGIRVAGLIAVDEASCLEFGAQWRASTTRRKLLERCVQTELAREEADAVMTWLGRLATAPRSLGIEQHELLSLAKGVANNSGWPIEARKRFSSVVRRALKSYTDDNAVFEVLAEIVRDVEHPEIQREAAVILCWPTVLRTGSRQQVVVELLATQKDEHVIGILEEGLKRFESAQSGSMP
jgi:hypothetical protein